MGLFECAEVLLLQDPMVVQCAAPVRIFGDIHGQVMYSCADFHDVIVFDAHENVTIITQSSRIIWQSASGPASFLPHFRIALSQGR